MRLRFFAQLGERDSPQIVAVNVFWIDQAWPFFLALVLAMMIAIQQFVLLVRMGFRSG